MATLAVVAMLGGLLLGCTSPSSGAPPVIDHGATVEATLPTAAPTEPPATVADSTFMPTDTPALPTYTPRPVPTRQGDGERAPATSFQAELLDGTEITLSDTFGTPTLLAFWAPW